MMLSGFMLAQAPSALRFQRALSQPERAQVGCLARVLRAVRGTV